MALPQFHKYHALGNDYIVLDPVSFKPMLTADWIRRLCHRNYGVGSDGILLGPLPVSPEAGHAGTSWALRIFNPDGGEAEKSGNGLRIFCRYLMDAGYAKGDAFTIETAGGIVHCSLLDGGQKIRVEMGRISFLSADIPVSGPPREVLRETIEVEGQSLVFAAATIGNPHCVIRTPQASPAQAKGLGPFIETDSRFPNRVNVQFMEILDRANIKIEIWERGAGYTLASGSSASACAAVAKRLGWCDTHVQVHMPGGTLEVTVLDDFTVIQTGPVTPVAHGGIDLGP